MVAWIESEVDPKARVLAVLKETDPTRPVQDIVGDPVIATPTTYFIGDEDVATKLAEHPKTPKANDLVDPTRVELVGIME